MVLVTLYTSLISWALEMDFPKICLFVCFGVFFLLWFPTNPSQVRTSCLCCVSGFIVRNYKLFPYRRHAGSGSMCRYFLISILKHGLAPSLSNIDQADFSGATHWIRAGIESLSRKLNYLVKKTIFKNMVIRGLQWAAQELDSAALCLWISQGSVIICVCHLACF